MQRRARMLRVAVPLGFGLGLGLTWAEGRASALSCGGPIGTVYLERISVEPVPMELPREDLYWTETAWLTERGFSTGLSTLDLERTE